MKSVGIILGNTLKKLLLFVPIFMIACFGTGVLAGTLLASFDRNDDVKTQSVEKDYSFLFAPIGIVMATSAIIVFQNCCTGVGAKSSAKYFHTVKNCKKYIARATLIGSIASAVMSVILLLLIGALALYFEKTTFDSLLLHTAVVFALSLDASAFSSVIFTTTNRKVYIASVLIGGAVILAGFIATIAFISPASVIIFTGISLLLFVLSVVFFQRRLDTAWKAD